MIVKVGLKKKNEYKFMKYQHSHLLDEEIKSQRD